MKLSLIDKKILYELDCNSRQPISKIAKNLRIGRDKVNYRINLLKDKDIIKKFTVTINPYKLGLIIYKTYLKLDSSKKKTKEFISYLKGQPRIYWLAECDGHWDLIFSTFANSPKEFHDIQDKILSEFHDVIIDFNVYTLVDVWFYRKNYLINKKPNYFFFGGKPDSISLDKIDWDILKILSENSRENIVDIAKRLKSTIMIVKHRIKKLEKNNIIVGYRVDIDISKLDMIFFKAQLYLNNYNSQLENKLREYCSLNPNITYYIKQIGNCKIELEIEAKNYIEFNKILNNIREKFDFIRNIDTILIRKEHFNWVPGN